MSWYSRAQEAEPDPGSDLPTGKCIDCHAIHPGEYYMIHDDLWAAIGDPEGELCIPCLEKRLGRKLNKRDFKPIPLNFADWMDGFHSPTLRDRLSREASFRRAQEGTEEQEPDEDILDDACNRVMQTDSTEQALLEMAGRLHWYNMDSLSDRTRKIHKTLETLSAGAVSSFDKSSLSTAVLCVSCSEYPGEDDPKLMALLSDHHFIDTMRTYVSLSGAKGCAELLTAWQLYAVAKERSEAKGVPIDITPSWRAAEILLKRVDDKNFSVTQGSPFG